MTSENATCPILAWSTDWQLLDGNVKLPLYQLSNARTHLHQKGMQHPSMPIYNDT